MSCIRLLATVVVEGDVPVDDVPKGGDVVGAAVLIVEIVCVLPDIQTDDGFIPIHERRILVCCGDDAQISLRSNYEPSPARAELCKGCLSEFCLKLFK